MRREKKLMIRSTAIQWRAFRLAATTHFHLFNKIVPGKLQTLLDAIENERREKEVEAERLANPPPPADELDGKDDIQIVEPASSKGRNSPKRRREEEDVEMVEGASAPKRAKSEIREVIVISDD